MTMAARLRTTRVFMIFLLLTAGTEPPFPVLTTGGVEQASLAGRFCARDEGIKKAPQAEDEFYHLECECS